MEPTVGSCFDTFGPCRFVPKNRPLGRLQVGTERRATRFRIRRDCPRSPGVYGMLDASGSVIYIGQSKRLRDRLLSYFSASAIGKARRIAEQAAELVWETTGHELTAQLRELTLIRRWRPRFNRRGQPGRRSTAYVCLGRRPAAYAYLSARSTKTADYVFGPIVGFRRGRQALAVINDHLQLRDCPEEVAIAFRDQGKLFDEPREAGCLRYELHTCLGPCIGACSTAHYNRQVSQAVALFAGTDRSLVDRLENDMAAAARDQCYELAAMLRDKLADVEWLLEQLERLREARLNYSFVYPVSNHAGSTNWYVIRGADVRHVVAAPRGGQPHRRCLDLLTATYDQHPHVADAPEDVEVVRLVAGWFRRHPHALKRVLSPEAAIAHCAARLPCLHQS
jgi:excinuclease ABC subunit C